MAKTKGQVGWALTFLIFAIIAGLLGFGFIAQTSIWIAKVLFVVFLIFFIISLIRHYVK